MRVLGFMHNVYRSSNLSVNELQNMLKQQVLEITLKKFNNPSTGSICTYVGMIVKFWNTNHIMTIFIYYIFRNIFRA